MYNRKLHILLNLVLTWSILVPSMTSYWIKWSPECISFSHFSFFYYYNLTNLVITRGLWSVYTNYKLKILINLITQIKWNLSSAFGTEDNRSCRKIHTHSTKYKCHNDEWIQWVVHKQIEYIQQQNRILRSDTDINAKRQKTIFFCI